MDINISDEKLAELAEQEVRKEISRRVQRVIDGGIAYWFSEQTIQRLTYECVDNMINREFVSTFRQYRKRNYQGVVRLNELVEKMYWVCTMGQNKQGNVDIVLVVPIIVVAHKKIFMRGKL